MRITYLNISLLVLVVIVAISGCDSRAHQNAKSTPLQDSGVAAKVHVGPTGQMVAHAKNKVIVVSNSPEKAKPKKVNLTVLKTQHTKTRKQLTKLIGTYAKNINDSDKKDKIASEMAKNLDVYKQQSLELYKEQMAAKTKQSK